MAHAVFRADATPQLGGGHLYRCLTLAHALAADGWECSFASNEEAEQVVPWLGHSSFRRMDAEMLGREPADLAVIDHYDLGSSYETSCRVWAKHILAIDDLANRQHDTDALLDQNIGRHEADYTGLVPPHCRVLVGPAYALLRPAFGEGRLAGWRLRHETRRVLVAMGATDPKNATGTVLAGLFGVPEVKVDVVLGAAAVHLNAVREQVQSFGDRCNLHVNIDDTAMATLIEEADLAVAAAGGSAWERCSLGLPTLLVVLAENQQAAANHLVAAGAAGSLGHVQDLTRTAVTAAIKDLIDDEDGLAGMSRAAALVSDGLGARRVAGMLSPERCGDGASVVLRPAKASDSEAIFSWQSMPGVRRYFNEPRPPTLEEHASWFAASLANTERLLNIIEVGGSPAGVLRLDRIRASDEAAGGGFLVSILVAPRFEGRGAAKAALRAARRLMARQRLVAEVMEANVASRRVFEASGYRSHGGVLINSGP